MIDKNEYLEDFIKNARIEEESEVISCDRCKGVGFVVWSERVPGHNSSMEYYKKICTICKGEGRLLEVKLVIYSSKNTKNISYYPITEEEKAKIKNLRVTKHG